MVPFLPQRLTLKTGGKSRAVFSFFLFLSVASLMARVEFAIFIKTFFVANLSDLQHCRSDMSVQVQDRLDTNELLLSERNKRKW